MQIDIRPPVEHQFASFPIDTIQKRVHRRAQLYKCDLRSIDLEQLAIGRPGDVCSRTFLLCYSSAMLEALDEIPKRREGAALEIPWPYLFEKP